MPPRRDRLRAVLAGLLCTLIIGAPLAIGTVHAWPRAVVFVACAIAAGIALFRRRERAFTITAPLIALLVAIVATALQLLPLPAAMVAVVSPHAHDVFSVVLDDYGWHAVSIDPAATLGELAKLAAYGAFLAAATAYARHEQRRRQLVLAVVIAATAVALIALVQVGLGTQRVLFFYQPDAPPLQEVVARGSFVNPNHFGALMVLGAAAALSMFLREPGLRPAMFAAILLINVAAVASLSRSALVCVPLAQALVFVIDRWRTRGGAHWRGAQSMPRVAIALGVACAIAISLTVWTDKWTRELEHTQRAELSEPLDNPRSKISLWSDASKLVWQYPWTGLGRGAFEQGFGHVTDRAGTFRFVWMENGYLESLVDWGAPVALLLLALALWSLSQAVKTLRPDPMAAGALGGLLALAVHEAADYSIELPGVAIPALALLATLFARKREESQVGRSVTVRSWYLAAPALVLLLGAWSPFIQRADDVGDRLQAIARDPERGADEMLRAGVAARSDHPADYRINALVARRLAAELAAMDGGTPPVLTRLTFAATMMWLNDALYLNPSYPGTHLIAAEVLASTGHRSQALLEYKTAVQYMRLREGLVWTRVAAHYQGLPALLAATPEQEFARLQLARWLYSKNRRADADRVYAAVLEDSPHNEEALAALANSAIFERDGPTSVSRATHLYELYPTPRSRYVLVSAHLANGDIPSATSLLDENPEKTQERFATEVRVVEILTKSGDLPGARRRLETVAWATERSQQIRIHELRADIERRAGNSYLHRWELEQAAQLKAN